MRGQEVIMSIHEEKAKQLFLEGYNCAQAVFCAFSDELGIDQETAMKISSSFGGGMGRLREVCGAVSGMFMAAGVKYGYSVPGAGDEKKEHYARIQQLAGTFKEKNGSIVCRDLLGLKQQHDGPVPEERTAEYYKKRPCVELVGDAARVLEAYILETEE